ncbi:MAG: cysteine desulfurase family protein [bacterium]
MIYFDNNDTTPLHPEVWEAMVPYFLEKFGNPSSLHRAGLEAEEAIELARADLARALGAEPREIIFTSSATEANNLAILGAARARPSRRHLIISSIEHISVSECARRLEKEGYRVTRLPVDGHGYVVPDSLEKAIDEETFLVSIIYASHEIGTIQELSPLAQIAHRTGAWFHTDAAQSLGKIPLSLAELGVDLASFNSHKIHGPKGVGALYVRKGIKLQRIMEGGTQEYDLRPGTENVPAIVGFAKAAQIAVRDINEVSTHLRNLTIRLATGLSSIPHTRLNGPSPEERLPGNLNVTFLYIEGEAILMHLSHRGIYVSSGSACSSRTLIPSPVLTAIGLLHEEAHGSIRFSMSRFNTVEEVDQVIKATGEVVDLLRSITAFVPALHSEKEGGHSFYRPRKL